MHPKQTQRQRGGVFKRGNVSHLITEPHWKAPGLKAGAGLAAAAAFAGEGAGGSGTVVAIKHQLI